MRFSLHQFDRLASSTRFVRNLTDLAPDWRRTTLAVGGYYQGGFTIRAGAMTKMEMLNYFQKSIGCRVEERYCGVVTWEGEIVQIDMTLDGVQWRVSLNSRVWFNKVKVEYTTQGVGKKVIDWSEETDSSDVFGESCYIHTMGDALSETEATDVQTQLLIENAYPRAEAINYTSAAGRMPQDQLKVSCAGYVFSMNRRICEDNHDAANFDSMISTLVAESEFVTAGDIDTNAAQIGLKNAQHPRRLWDQINEIIDAGDGSGNRWVGGVYGGRRFNYNAAETDPKYWYWREGRLYSLNGHVVPAPLVRPDIIVRMSDSAPIVTPGGGSSLDNPREIYIEGVEFIAPNQLKLIPQRGDARPSFLERLSWKDETLRDVEEDAPCYRFEDRRA